MHATWNALSKRAAGVPGLFLSAGSVSAVAAAPLLLALWPRTDMPAKVWCCLAISGPAVGIYLVALERAYQTGEMTFVYPLARSLPVLMLLTAEMSMGIAHSTLGLVGPTLILAGSAVLPLGQKHRRVGAYARVFRTPAMLWAVLAALGTVAYSVSDKIAMQHLKGSGLSAIVWYTMAEFAVATAVLWLAECRDLTRVYWQTIQARWPMLLLIGVLIEWAYLPILLALQNNNVSYVVACRQFSIVLGTGLGLTWLGEKEAVLGRVLGSLTITAGIVLTALAR